MNFERTREIRIKRANTDWWINEKSVVGTNGKTYIAYTTDMGEIHLKEIDAKCSRAQSYDVTLSRFNCDYADEHNAPSVCITESGRIIVAYTGHASTTTLKYRVTEKPYDIFSFGPERVLEYGKSVTYAQLFENVHKKQLWLFCRVDCVTWEFRYSCDEGETWSENEVFLRSEDGGLFYLDIRRQTVSHEAMFSFAENRCGNEHYLFALYGHPLTSVDHTIRGSVFDADGWLLDANGKRTDFNLYPSLKKSGVKLMAHKELPVIYASPKGTTARLLEVSLTVPMRVGFAAFIPDKPETITYYISTLKNGKWQLSKEICRGGEFLGKGVVDGSETYVGGMACYYGVGEAGLNPRIPADTVTNKVYIARFDGESRLLECYITHDGGETYTLKEVIRKIPDNGKAVKIWRPTVPVYAQDNLPVYWHEGTYNSHSGGWHCDAVMLVEYDD